jgi:hypothetical protein
MCAMNSSSQLATNGRETGIVPDMPVSERITSVMRVAKLVSNAGEILCVVCELSPTELRARLFHPLAEARFMLELPNGTFHFVERTWERENEAGFRFSQAIDLKGFIAEADPFQPRRIRLRTKLPATVAVADAAHPMVIQNLSQDGALIEAEAPLSQHQRVRIDCAPIFSARQARVQWKSQSRYGLSFENGFSLVQLAEIARSIRDTSGQNAPGTNRLEVVHRAA